MSRLATARYREFKVMVRDEELACYSGIGMTTEAVLEVEAPGDEEWSEEYGECDLVIWEGNRVVAVIRNRAGRIPEVRRFKN